MHRASEHATSALISSVPPMVPITADLSIHGLGEHSGMPQSSQMGVNKSTVNNIEVSQQTYKSDVSVNLSSTSQPRLASQSSPYRHILPLPPIKSSLKSKGASNIKTIKKSVTFKASLVSFNTESPILAPPHRARSSRIHRPGSNRPIDIAPLESFLRHATPAAFAPNLIAESAHKPASTVAVLTGQEAFARLKSGLSRLRSDMQSNVPFLASGLSSPGSSPSLSPGWTSDSSPDSIRTLPPSLAKIPKLLRPLSTLSASMEVERVCEESSEFV
ncbi:hypothetical protein BC830DRAFT_1172799 [Chytriomyces sp. MP71]|nr:hypothetical protein BC830DRAFT_1172799 [Chytriomyces sp. MP71]